VNETASTPENGAGSVKVWKSSRPPFPSWMLSSRKSTSSTPPPASAPATRSVFASNPSLAHAYNSKLKIAVAGVSSPRAALLHRAGASEVVITDDLIADALVDRLDKGTRA